MGFEPTATGLEVRCSIQAELWARTLDLTYQSALNEFRRFLVHISDTMDTNPFEAAIIASLKETVPTLDEKAFLGLLELPKDPTMGDIAFPCFKIAAQLKQSPIALALDLEKKLIIKSPIEKVKAVGPYLNFFYTPSLFADFVLRKVLSLSFATWSSSNEKIMIEFVSPNVNKPLHLGHALQGCLGTALSRLFEQQGNQVIKCCLFNDRGAHICKSMLAYEKFGHGETPESSGKKGDFLCGEYYVIFAKNLEEHPELEEQAQNMLKEWEDGNVCVRALWSRMRGWCLDGFSESFNRFGIQFDVAYAESDLYTHGKDIVKDGLTKGVFAQREDGSIWVDLKKYGMSEKTLMRKDGTSIYITQDLYLAKKKFSDHQLTQSLTITASEQNMHFAQLYKILELLQFEHHAGLKHLGTGMVLLPEGRMKSREGTVVDADSLLDELEEAALTELVSRYPNLDSTELTHRKKAIAKAALYFFLLRSDAKKDMTFNPKESVSFDGETGPYLLYSYARAKSVLRKADIFEQDSFELLTHEKEQELIRNLNQFPRAIEESTRNLSPHTLCQYLTKLASSFNGFYQSVSVMQADSVKLKNARLSLVSAYATTLNRGLNLLGIETLEEM